MRNVISRESPMDVARRVAGPAPFAGTADGGVQRQQPQGLRGGTQNPALQRPESATDTFARWNLEKALTTRIPGARGLTANQRNLMFQMQEAPKDRALKEAELGMRQQGQDRAQQSLGLQREQLGLQRERLEMDRTNALSGLLGNVLPGTTPTADNPVGAPIVRSGNSFSYGTQPTSEDEALEQGGPVRGLRKVGKGPDNVPAWLTEGEYVLPVETVEQVGEENLDEVVRNTTGKEPGGKPKKGLRGYQQGGRIDASIPERRGPPRKRVDEAPVGAGLVKQAVKNLIGLRGRTERLEKEAMGYAQGGYATSPERQAWLADIAARGNQMPEAQEALARQQRRTFQDADIASRPEVQQRALQEAAAARVAAAPEMTQAPPTLRQRLDARGQQGVNALQGVGQQFGENLARADLRNPFRKPEVGDTMLGPYIVGSDPAAAQQARTLEARHNEIMRPDFNPYGTIPMGDTPGGLMTPEAQNRTAFTNPSELRKQARIDHMFDNDLAEFRDMGSGIAKQIGHDGRVTYTNVGVGNVTDPDKKMDMDRVSTIHTSPQDYINMASSSNEGLRRRGLMGLAQMQQGQQAVQTGNPQMDNLLRQIGDPSKAASVYRALNSGSSSQDKAAALSEQRQRMAILSGGDEKLGDQKMAEAMRAQVNMLNRLRDAGASVDQIKQMEAAVQNGLLMPEFERAFAIKELLGQNTDMRRMGRGAGLWGGLAGTAGGLATLGVTRNPALALKVAGGMGLTGLATGGATGYASGVGNFDPNMPLDDILFQDMFGAGALQPTSDGDFKLGNTIIPKALVERHPQLFAPSAPR